MPIRDKSKIPAKKHGYTVEDHHLKLAKKPTNSRNSIMLKLLHKPLSMVNASVATMIYENFLEEKKRRKAKAILQ